MEKPSQASWLTRIRDAVSDETPAVLQIQTAQGKEEFQLSRTEIDHLLGKTTGHHRRRTWLFAGLLLVTLGVLAIVGLNTAQLGERYAAKTLQFESLTSSVGRLTAEAERIGETQIPSDSEKLESQLESISELLADTDRAFRLYVEITRDLVAERRANLTDGLSLAGIDPDIALSLASEELRLGGLMTGEDRVEQILAHYLDDSLSANLDELSTMSGFQDNLPDLPPVMDARVTSKFGMRRHPVTGKYRSHRGIDLASDTNFDILAAGAGRVTFVGRDGDFGKKVIIDHGMGMETIYAHLSRIHVDNGQWVARGDKLGTMGKTGRATGIHLHYEVRFEGQPLDPAKIFTLDVALNAPAEASQIR